VSYLNSLVGTGDIQGYNMNYYGTDYSINNNEWKINTNYTSTQLIQIWISTEIVDAVYVTTPIPTAEIVDILPKTSTTNRVKITDQITASLTLKNTGTAKGQFDVFAEATPSGTTEILSPQSPVIDAEQNVTLYFTVKNLGTTEYLDVNIIFYVKEHESGTLDDNETLYTQLVPTAKLGTLIIWTEGEPNPNTAKIYINGLEVTRNVGSTYTKEVLAGSYLISFETIKDYKISIYVNNILKGDITFTTVTVNEGQTTSVKGLYTSTIGTTLLDVLVTDKDTQSQKLAGVSVFIKYGDKNETKVTGLDGIVSFNLGDFQGNVTIEAQVGFFSAYYPNCIVKTVTYGSNSATLSLESKMLFWIIVSGGAVGVVASMVGAYIYYKKRRTVMY
jgi:hypothetical protein